MQSHQTFGCNFQEKNWASVHVHIHIEKIERKWNACRWRGLNNKFLANLVTDVLVASWTSFFDILIAQLIYWCNLLSRLLFQSWMEKCAQVSSSQSTAYILSIEELKDIWTKLASCISVLVQLVTNHNRKFSYQPAHRTHVQQALSNLVFMWLLITNVMTNNMNTIINLTWYMDDMWCLQQQYFVL